MFEKLSVMLASCVLLDCARFRKGRVSYYPHRRLISLPVYMQSWCHGREVRWLIRVFSCGFAQLSTLNYEDPRIPTGLYST